MGASKATPWIMGHLELNITGFLSIIDRDFMINILLIVQVFGQAVLILLHIED